MRLIEREQIIAALDHEAVQQALKDGFIAYSRGQVSHPAAQQFTFAEAQGDACIKSAWMQGSDYFAIKVSSGFYANAEQGLPSNSGLVLLLSARTGQPVALLRDGGWLTSMRTAMAGAMATQLLLPAKVQAIGIYGTGEQAQQQLRALLPLTSCREVIIWGRSQAGLARIRAALADLPLHLTLTEDRAMPAHEANLLVTTTPSREPLIDAVWLRPGMHITAVGADAPGKQELDAAVLARADIILADSRQQCDAYGEISHARRAGFALAPVQELGEVLAQPPVPRPAEAISVADLTGLGIQDLQIARCVMAALGEGIGSAVPA